MRSWLYLIYILHALVFSLVISQFDFVATAIAAIIPALGAIL
jgi:hypothetical protein